MYLKIHSSAQILKILFFFFFTLYNFRICTSQIRLAARYSQVCSNGRARLQDKRVVCVKSVESVKRWDPLLRQPTNQCIASNVQLRVCDFFVTVNVVSCLGQDGGETNETRMNSG